MSNVNTESLLKSFKYLNEINIYKAHEVWSRWTEALNTDKEKCPEFFIKKRIEAKSYTDWKNIKEEIIKSCQVKPSLILCVHAPLNRGLLRGCFCNFLPVNCYTVTLSYDDKISKKIRPIDSIASIMFPDDPNIKISTITLSKDLKKSGIYCNELKLFINNSLRNSIKLKTVFEDYFNNDSSMESCMLFLCNNNETSIEKDLVESLKFWFPNKDFPFWGGMVDELSVCNHLQKAQECNANNARCVVILIGGPEMTTYSITLNTVLETTAKKKDKLISFKENITLKNRSIGFIFSKNPDNYLLALDSSIYHQYFSNIPLFICFGYKSLGKSLDDAYEKIKEDLQPADESVLMILTFN